MIVFRAITIVVLLIFHTNATADEPNPFDQFIEAVADDAPTDTEASIWISGELAKCAGLNEAMSIAVARYGKEATAKTLHQTNLGARLVAAWFLANDHYERTGKQKAIGEFSEHVDNIAETRKTYYLAMVENGDFSAVKEPMKECAELSKLQADVIEYLRASSFLSEE